MPTTLKVLRDLGKAFGTTENEQGYKVLPPQLRVIWGDGIDHKGIKEILYWMEANDWSADNIAFGMGGGLLQKCNRDTQKFAIKASYAVVNGQSRDVFKDPVTDSGKMSKKGRLALVKEVTERDRVEWFTKAYYNEDELPEDQLNTVFENGALAELQTFEEIRGRAVL